MFDFTTASDTDLKKVYDAIGAEIGDDKFFTSKELAHLPKVLEPQEQVLAFASGLVDGSTWLVVGTDKRVLFLDKGMIFGLKQISIEMDRINSVEGDTGFVFGTIKVSDSSKTYEVTYVRKQTVVTFTNKVRAAIRARREGVQLESPRPEGLEQVISAVLAQAATASSSDDIVGQIERLTRLRDTGAISNEEFASGKARILNL